MKISSPLSVLLCTPRTTFRISALVLALSSASMATTHSQAAVSYNDKGVASYSILGDLSIYQPPVGETQPTVMLMLDKSGSMGNFYRSGYGRIDSLWIDYGSVDYKKVPYSITENKEIEKRERVCVDKKGNGDCKNNGWEWKIYTVTESVTTTY